jgi:hypothetical protein
MLDTIVKFLTSPASFTGGPGGFSINGPAIVVVPALLSIILSFFASLAWLWQDARKRNKNGLVALLFILLTGWPASFIWWFWLRPPTTLRS